MPSRKTAILTFRIEPGLKEALRAAASREHRSISNMVGVLIRHHCGRNGIAVPALAAAEAEAGTTRHGAE